MDQRMMRRREAAKYLEVRGIPISGSMGQSTAQARLPTPLSSFSQG